MSFVMRAVVVVSSVMVVVVSDANLLFPVLVKNSKIDSEVWQ